MLVKDYNSIGLSLKNLTPGFLVINQTFVNFSDNQKIIFQRLTIRSEEELSFQDCQDPIVNTEVHLDGRIGDLESSHVEMDFANKYVGFGRTGTQVARQKQHILNKQQIFAVQTFQ